MENKLYKDMMSILIIYCMLFLFPFCKRQDIFNCFVFKARNYLSLKLLILHQFYKPSNQNLKALFLSILVLFFFNFMSDESESCNTKQCEIIDALFFLNIAFNPFLSFAFCGSTNV